MNKKVYQKLREVMDLARESQDFYLASLLCTVLAAHIDGRIKALAEYTEGFIAAESARLVTDQTRRN